MLRAYQSFRQYIHNYRIYLNLMSETRRLLQQHYLSHHLDIDNDARSKLITLIDQLYIADKTLFYYSSTDDTRTLLWNLIRLRDSEIFKKLCRLDLNILLNDETYRYIGPYDSLCAFKFAMLKNNPLLIALMMTHVNFDHSKIGEYLKFAIREKLNLDVLETLNTYSLDPLSTEEFRRKYSTVKKSKQTNPNKDAVAYIFAIQNPHIATAQGEIPVFIADSYKQTLRNYLRGTKTTPLALAIQHNRVDAVIQFFEPTNHFYAYVTPEKINHIEHDNYVAYALSLENVSDEIIIILFRHLHIPTKTQLLLLSHDKWEILKFITTPVYDNNRFRSNLCQHLFNVLYLGNHSYNSATIIEKMVKRMLSLIGSSIFSSHLIDTIKNLEHKTLNNSIEYYLDITRIILKVSVSNLDISRMSSEISSTINGLENLNSTPQILKKMTILKELQIILRPLIIMKELRKDRTSYGYYLPGDIYNYLLFPMILDKHQRKTQPFTSEDKRPPAEMRTRR